jgi:hypothetical protein
MTMSQPLAFRREAWPGTSAFGGPAGQSWAGEAEVPFQAAAMELLKRRAMPLHRVIPDDPDFRKHIPINYRLNAKAIVGVLAHDLSSGKSLHTSVDVAHGAITATEIFTIFGETSALAGGLAVVGPALGLAAQFLALGAGYQEAAAKVATEWAATGFSRGVVLGAEKRFGPRHVVAYFGNLSFPSNPVFPRGRAIAMANHKAGLVAGFLQGRLLSPNQRAIFWRDLGRRMGDQSFRGPQKQWGRPEWVNLFTDLAAVFKRDHLVAGE